MKADREQKGLMGPVHTASSKILKFSKRGKIYEENLLSAQIITYEAEGNKVEEINYNGKTLTVRTVYTYNVNGRITEATDYDHNGRLIAKTAYTYDAEGRLAEWGRYRADGVLGVKGISIYDSEGKRTEQISEGAYAGKEIYVYDDKGHKIELGVYALELARSIESSYDIRGNPNEVTFYSEEGHSLRKVTLNYNSKGNLIEVTDFINDAFAGINEGLNENNELVPFFKSVYTYDVEDRLVEDATYDSSSNLLDKKVFAYDAKGKLSEMAEYITDGSLSARYSYARDFDQHGNWIKEIKLKWNNDVSRFEPSIVTYRAIAYY